MDRVSISDAIAKVHEKEKEVRAAYVPFDTAMLRVRREYMLSMDNSEWLANIAARLELMNKDHRAGLRMSLHNLHNKLYKLYSDVGNTEPDADDEGPMAVILTGGRAAREGKIQDEKAINGVDLMADMKAKHAGAVNLCQRLEGLMHEVTVLHEMYGKDTAVPVKDRVRLRRGVPRFMKHSKEAMEKKENIEKVVDEWMPYFVTLANKDALNQLIETNHSMKISKRVFLAKAKPHCEKMVRLCSARDSLVCETSQLVLRLETAWLSSPFPTLPVYRLDFQLRKFELFLARAQNLVVEHDAVEKALEELADLAGSPTAVPGLDGGEVVFSRLKEAYFPYRQFIALLDATIKLCTPLVDEMETMVSTFSRDSAK